VSGWFRLHDSRPGSGMVELDPHEAHDWNARGWGVFATVQLFRGARRTENLVRIRSWSIDIDHGDKADQCARILRAPLVPSSVVETKKGHHVHWYATTARAEYYRGIVARLVEFFRADRRAMDLARVLRVPGYLHLKDPKDPFLVHHVHGPVASLRYTEAQMLSAFPPTEEENRHRQQHREQQHSEHVAGEDFWERVYNLDCHRGLELLSGTSAVGGEQYTFKQNASGTHNVLVDGKSTSCWVDGNGRIGSADKGGPTLYAWLRWFGSSPRECVRVLKELFPDLEEKR
jgi:hypothetical protein